jgi:AraC-like DNA-binding protein
VELVVNFGAPLVLETDNGGWLETPRIWFKGLTTKSMRLRATGSAQLLGVRLYPWVMGGLFDTQAVQGHVPILPPTSVLADLTSALQVSVQRSDPSGAITCLQEIVTDVGRRRQIDSAPIQHSIELLYASHGQIRMTEIAARTYLSSRQFERQFKRVTGVSPKTLARLIRFEAIRNRLSMEPIHAPSELIHDFGYTDQAHLIHDFKAHAGMTPRAYAAMVAQGQYAGFLQDI